MNHSPPLGKQQPSFGQEVRRALAWPCLIAVFVYCLVWLTPERNHATAQVVASLAALAYLSVAMLLQPLDTLPDSKRELLTIISAITASVWCLGVGYAIAVWADNFAYLGLGLLLAPFLWVLYFSSPEAPQKKPDEFSHVGTVDELQENIAHLWDNEDEGLGRIVQLVCAGVRLPFETARELNFLFVGDIAAGKTVLFKQFMRAVLSHVRPERKLRALVYDAKNKLMPFIDAVKPKDTSIYMLNPKYAAAYAYDLAADCYTAEDFGNVANALTPNRGSNKHDEYFSSMSRLLAKHSMMALTDERGREWDFLDVVFTILDPDWHEHILTSCEEGRILLSNLGSQETKDNILSSVISYFGKFIPLLSQMRRHAADGRTLSANQWLHSPSILVLGGSDSHETPLSALNRIIIERLKNALLDGELNPDRPDNRTFFFLDEFADFGRFDAMNDLMRKGRDFGVCAVLAFQNLSDVLSAYGDEQACKALLGHTANRVYLRMKADSAEWAAKEIGQCPQESATQITRNSRTGDKSISKAIGGPKTYDYLVHPSKLQHLTVTKGTGVRGYLSTPLSSVVAKFFIPWDQIIDMPSTERTDYYTLCPHHWQRIDPVWRKTNPQPSDAEMKARTSDENPYEALLGSIDSFMDEVKHEES